MKRLNNKKVLLLIFVLLGIGGWWGYGIFFGKNASTPQRQTTKTTRDTIVSSVSASGKVITANMINVSTEATGIVTKVYVNDGTKVVRGQKIAEVSLDLAGQQKQAAAWSSYLSSKNNVDSAKTNIYTLQSQLFAANQKFINDAVARELASDDPTYIQQNADWLAAEAKYKAGQANIDQSKSALNSTWLSYQNSSSSINAPMSGVVNNISIVEGMTLSVSTPRLAVISSTDKAIVNLDLSEMDVKKVKQGQKVIISFDSLEDQTFTGVVKAVDRIGSTSTNVTTYPVIVVLDTTSGSILPNMAVTGEIILTTKSDVLTVPTSAVTIANGSSLVTKIVKGKEEQLNVTVGISSDSLIEIVDGLVEGDEVVTGYTSSATTSTQTGSSVFGGLGGFRSGGAGGAGGQIRINR